MFEPTGFFGILYWYALFPAHKFIFSALMHAIEADAHRYRETVSSALVKTSTSAG